MSETLDNNAGAGGRPTFLTVICILSFVGIGLAIIGYIGAFALLGVAESAMSGMEDMASEYGGTTTTASTGMIWAYIIVGFLTAIVSLVGVLQMWKLKKSGFMLYAGATVVALIMGVVYAGVGASIMSIVVSGAFIAMYYMNLKHMS